MQRMRKEVSPILAVVLILAALAAVQALYWRALLRDERRSGGAGGGMAGGRTTAASEVGLEEVRVETIAGGEQAGYQDGDCSESLLDGPVAVAVRGDAIYIADSRNDAVRILRSGRVSTLAGGRQENGGLASSVLAPAGLAAAPDGTILVADTGHHRIARLEQDGTLVTYAGAPTPRDDLGIETGGHRDGAASQAQFRYPVGLAVDAEGTVYVADAGNGAVRRISHGQVTTIASDGPLTSPTAVCLDANGSLWVSDTGGAALWTGPPRGPLRKWKPQQAEEGFSPAGIALAADDAGEGRVYVADCAGNRLYRIEGDRLMLVAGRTGAATVTWADGTGDKALLLCPAGLAAGKRGELYLADYGNNRVRVVRLGRTHAALRRGPGSQRGGRTRGGRSSPQVNAKENRRAG